MSDVKEPCEICGEPTSTGADIDTGTGYKRHPVCKVADNPTCLDELMERFQGGMGSQMRSIYPSREDI